MNNIPVEDEQFLHQWQGLFGIGYTKQKDRRRRDPHEIQKAISHLTDRYVTCAPCVGFYDTTLLWQQVVEIIK